MFMIYYEVVHQVIVLASNFHKILYHLNAPRLWRLRLGAWGLLLVPWARILLMLGAWISISGPNLFQFLDIRLSSNRSVDHWAWLQLLTFNVSCFIVRSSHIFCPLYS